MRKQSAVKCAQAARLLSLVRKFLTQPQFSLVSLTNWIRESRTSAGRLMWSVSRSRLIYRAIDFAHSMLRKSPRDTLFNYPRNGSYIYRPLMSYVRPRYPLCSFNYILAQTLNYQFFFSPVDFSSVSVNTFFLCYLFTIHSWLNTNSKDFFYLLHVIMIIANGIFPSAVELSIEIWAFRGLYIKFYTGNRGRIRHINGSFGFVRSRLNPATRIARIPVFFFLAGRRDNCLPSGFRGPFFETAPSDCYHLGYGERKGSVMVSSRP